MAKKRSATPGKGLRGSKAGLVLSLGSSALAVIRASKQVRRAKGTHDKLNTADAVAGMLPLITSAALVLRQLRGRKRETQETA
ncbi:hypothetical protein IX27_02265 [Streptomyces sp. JS01]|uniref:hypothetical protein n=1 Tax=unclassified Streptomyces TaxID=2593676 RepID=UPI0004FFCFE3|nr:MULTISPECIES: hypothetical protein [unclassified Streptomyces]KFK89889.1 hypothetical protein IX27_02265 [Streptomyces sp. JS01]MBK3531091.1 hypothetical protein [Streptomyces sp. MBT72]MBK3535522.1 hypothetical protein [Streptomyces sp. MBT67]MBK3552439.1 hypothetical protein [Streptomyces sp. MBT61]MBK6030550.1 hypothetical protein [Streptomyces sp. MBT59]